MQLVYNNSSLHDTERLANSSYVVIMTLMKKKTSKIAPKAKTPRKRSIRSKAETFNWTPRNIVISGLIVIISIAVFWMYNASLANTPLSTSEYAAKLESCKPGTYKLQSKLLPSMILPIEIKGYEAGKCVTVTKLPNNGRTTCKYAASSLKQVASEYVKSETPGNYDILQKYNDDGTCVSSGY